MDVWLLLFLIHAALLLAGSCHCSMYDQVMSYSSGYGVPMVYTYPYSGAYYGQRIMPMNPMAQMYGMGSYPIVRNAMKPYVYSRRTSGMDDDGANSGDGHQTANEPYKISLMTDNVQQMMNNGQKEVLSMMTAADDGPRFARVFVKQRRSAPDGGAEAAAAAPDMLSRGLETMTSWYRDAVPTPSSMTAAAPDMYSRGMETASSWYRDAVPTPSSMGSAAQDMYSRGMDTVSSWHRDAKPVLTPASTYYPQSGTTQGGLYPNLSYMQQPMNYNPGMMSNNPMNGGYPNMQSYGNNMNYPPPPTYYPTAQQFPSGKQSAPSFVDTMITALPEIRKLTRVVAPYVMGAGGPSARTARQSDEYYMLGASNPIVSPYITKKENPQQQKQTLAMPSGDSKQTVVQQRYADNDMMSGDSGDQMVRSSWSPYLSDSMDMKSYNAFEYPYAYEHYEPDAKVADDSGNLASFRDSGLGYDDDSYRYGDDNTMLYGDEGDLYKLYSGYY